MLVNTNFKKSVLCSSMHAILCWNMPKKLGLSLFLGLVASSSFAESLTVPNSNAQLAENPTPLQTPTAEEAQNLATEIKQLAAAQGKDSAEDLQKIEEALEQTQTPEFNSLEMLQQQQQAGASFAEFQPIEFEDLEDLPIAPVDQELANQIFQVAEQAKQEAMLDRNGQVPETLVQDATQQELLQIDQAPVNVDQLMTNIQADSNFVVEANPADTLMTELGWMTQDQNTDKPGFFRRLLYKVRPPRELNTAKVPRISADVVISANSAQNGTQNAIGEVSPEAYRTAVDNLSANIKAKLSSFTQESFADFPSALPQLRTLSNQAAQAVGFYNAEFKFEKLNDSRVRVHVVPNPPVAIKQQNIEFTGEGQYEAQFQVIGVLPDQEVDDDVFNHGLYEQTKKRITDAASDNGYFDSYWRLHDVKVAQPQNTADINLRYETGERYKLGNVEFRMSDPNKEFPLDMDILQSMVTWQDNADYTFWRVNGLANNLTNSRYFNYTLVDTIRPDPVEHPLELPPDIQALVDQQKLSIYDATVVDQKRMVSSQEVTQSVVNETEFAGTEEGTSNDKLRMLQVQQEDKQSEEERLKQQARIDKKIPVIVTLNADRLNSAEVGAGFGTDTGVRLRGQYRRAIVNKRGHSFDANLELSQIRQAIDGRYNIPYNHPLNDYIKKVKSYEREERNNVAQGGGLMIESAVAGVDRVIKKPMGSWQHTFGLRYRLDRLTEDGTVFLTKPDAFIANGNEQQSLLLGYEVSRTDSNRRVNPSKGFRQIYKIELGSESLLSDADLAILNAGWRFIYSLGENDNHQFVGRSDLGYIFTEDFNKVPYNLRYFSGGDQSLRGFDYKSLSPQIEGFKIGGQALAVGSLEYNYQFKEGWRAAVFSDFGNAYDKDFSNDTEYSVGLGVRWASPIGPIRIDVASGISDEKHPIRLHFFIGSQI